MTTSRGWTSQQDVTAGKPSVPAGQAKAQVAAWTDYMYKCSNVTGYKAHVVACTARKIALLQCFKSRRQHAHPVQPAAEDEFPLTKKVPSCTVEPADQDTDRVCPDGLLWQSCGKKLRSPITLCNLEGQISTCRAKSCKAAWTAGQKVSLDVRFCILHIKLHRIMGERQCLPFHCHNLQSSHILSVF